MRYGESQVVTAVGILTWNGLVPPDKNDKTGEPVWTIGFAFQPGTAEHGEMDIIGKAALEKGKIALKLVDADYQPFLDCDVAKFGPIVNGMKRISAKTYNGMPRVIDKDGADIPMQALGQLLYPGCKIKLMVHAYPFNNKSKGVNFGLDGVQIIDATAPKLDVGAGVPPAEVGNAFAQAAGGGASAAPADAPTMPKPPIKPNAAFIAPPPPKKGPTLTAEGVAAGGDYDAFIQAGWTHEDLLAAGYVLP